MRDTALPHLPPHLGTSPCKPVAMWVPPSCNTRCWKPLRCGLIRRSLNSRSLFSFYRVPKPSFLLASNLPNIPTLCLYITPSLVSCFPKWTSRQSHSFICSYFLLLWNKSTSLFKYRNNSPCPLISGQKQPGVSPDHCPQLMIFLGERLGEEGIGIP